MWSMVCDVMPTISEDGISQRGSQFTGEDPNFEHLMVSMLDERDKLMESLRESQDRLSETEAKLSDVEKERDSLQRQITANLPQVCTTAPYYRPFTTTPPPALLIPPSPHIRPTLSLIPFFNP
jgi:septal ring factor EnvC (AmiA/AmiB activator)